MKRIFILLALSIICVNINAQLSGVNPNNAQQGQSLSVSISGINTHFSQATNTTIWFSQGSSTVILPTNFTAVTNTLINASMYIPGNQTLGLYNLNVANSLDGNLYLPLCFTISINPTQPSIISVNPAGAYAGQTLNVTISGQNTHFNQGTGTLTWFKQGSSTIIYPGNINSASATTIYANYPIPSNAALGYYDTYTFNNNDGLLVKNASFLINAASFYQINATSNPVMGGNITGNALSYLVNDTCKLIANPNTGYYFVNWTENGNIVSTNSNFSFVVISNRTLVANFSLINQYLITALISPMQAGSATGGGSYNLNQLATLHASSNMGWYFNNWTENGNIVSPDSIYSFIVTNNRTLVANFNPVISVPEIDDNKLVKIYPNPVTNYMFVNYEGPIQKDVDLKLYDIYGKLIYSQTISKFFFPAKIDVSFLKEGIYFIDIHQNKNKLLSSKILVTR